MKSIIAIGDKCLDSLGRIFRSNAMSKAVKLKYIKQLCNQLYDMEGKHGL